MTDNKELPGPSALLLENIYGAVLLGYLAAYFLVPYKPWLSPISFHTPLLGAGLLLYAARILPELRRGAFSFPRDLVFFLLAAGVFMVSAGIVHFREFSRAGVQAFTVSLLCFFFVRSTIRAVKLETLFLGMKIYLIVSCILILLQVSFAGPFYVAGYFGQMNFGKWTQGWGFGNTHIWAGGAIAWMLSIILARYAAPQKEKMSVSAETFYLLSMGLGAVGLFYTLNRGAWVGMFLALLVLAAVFIWSRCSLRNFFKGLAVMFIFVSVFRIAIHPDVYRMKEKMSFLRSDPRNMLANDAATLTRIKAWGVALNGIRANPFWGLGVGQFPQYYEKAFPGLFKGLAADKFDPNTKQIPHNSYLYYASEAGLLPAAFLFLFMGVVLIGGLRSGAAAEVFPFFIGGLMICVWMLTCDYINERIFWISLGAVAGLGVVYDRNPAKGAKVK